jgi:hypothetical protein
MPVAVGEGDHRPHLGDEHLPAHREVCLESGVPPELAGLAVLVHDGRQLIQEADDEGGEPGRGVAVRLRRRDPVDVVARGGRSRIRNRAWCIDLLVTPRSRVHRLPVADQWPALPLGHRAVERARLPGRRAKYPTSRPLVSCLETSRACCQTLGMSDPKCPAGFLRLRSRNSTLPSFSWRAAERPRRNRRQ